MKMTRCIPFMIPFGSFVILIPTILSSSWQQSLLLFNNSNSNSNLNVSTTSTSSIVMTNSNNNYDKDDSMLSMMIQPTTTTTTTITKGHSSSSSSSYKQQQRQRQLENQQNQHYKIPLYDLINTNVETSCNDGLILFQNDLTNNDNDYNDNDDLSSSATKTSTSTTTIPKYIHVTSKSQCITKEFYDNLQLWKTKINNHNNNHNHNHNHNYKVIFHNDAAVDRLLQNYWPEFPESFKAIQCLVSGAGKADFWRALVLYEYGGIYTDIDSAPGPLLLISTSTTSSTTTSSTTTSSSTTTTNNNSTIPLWEVSSFHNNNDNDNTSSSSSLPTQSFFVVEQGGWLSQYFAASIPNHPLLWIWIHKLIQRLYTLNDVDHQYVPRSTGPGALKYAFIAFMEDQGPNIYEGAGNCNSKHPYKYGHVVAGHYTGWNNATVTVVGTKEFPNEYIIREHVKSSAKHAGYAKMNMTHFSNVLKKKTKTKTKTNTNNNDHDALGHEESTVSCFRRIYEQQQQQYRMQQQQQQQQGQIQY